MPPLAAVVRGDGSASQIAGQGTDIDDFTSLAMLDHPLGSFAADQERTGQVGVDDFLPVGTGELDHRLAMLNAGVVDQDIHRDVLLVEGGEGVDNTGFVAHIKGAGS